jgi:hypothetical protein
MKYLIAFIAAAIQAGLAFAIAPANSDLVLINERSRDEATLYVGERREYIDRASLDSASVDDITYHTARSITIRPNYPPGIIDVAVICEHEKLGLALSIRKLGRLNEQGAEYSIDNGKVRSLSDFDLVKLEQKPKNLFSKMARAICNISQNHSQESNR